MRIANRRILVECADKSIAQQFNSMSSGLQNQAIKEGLHFFVNKHGTESIINMEKTILELIMENQGCIFEIKNFYVNRLLMDFVKLIVQGEINKSTLLGVIYIGLLGYVEKAGKAKSRKSSSMKGASDKAVEKKVQKEDLAHDSSEMVAKAEILADNKKTETKGNRQDFSSIFGRTSF